VCLASITSSSRSSSSRCRSITDKSGFLTQFNLLTEQAVKNTEKR
jgi:hypothetical protein